MQAEEADKTLAWNIANLAILCYVCTAHAWMLSPYYWDFVG